MKSLDFVIHELNPKYDINVIKEALKPLDPLNNPHKENLIIFLSRACSLIKPAFRGGTAGAGIGALVSSITKTDVGTGASYGAILGAGIDYFQFYSRAIYQVIKSGLK